MTGPSYEFTVEQNDVIGRLASRMRVVGVVLMTLGAVAALAALLSGKLPAGPPLAALLQGLIVGAIGWWTVRAAGWFNRVVRTEGEDITNLMGALSELRRLYDLQFWLLLVLLLLAVLAGAGVVPPAPSPAPPPATG